MLFTGQPHHNSSMSSHSFDGETAVLQARGIPAIVCCHVQHQAFAAPSRSQLTQLSELIDSSLNYYANVGQALTSKQAAKAAAADIKFTDVPRVYL